MARLSGLQRDVLSLYRQCLRALKEKPNDTRHHFRDFARNEFRKHLDVGKKDFSTIEYLLRRGRNQLETYRDPGIRDIHG
ncbi:complex 1 protein-domain-containing protein [Paraphoma chrysanthemicola]|uniref:Complex 1 protein-domain-containing protein n=1 Tax=Paraphoma chrysanthemicola TaxID=798071 RepID=A0A8K0VRN5_9PLEO|nr:complex 1 protein-domain-containing protein [Paraphoma chrysanthemicola]KAH7072731.1 complex 1 protein-domain-containing protein [Paraphoma chrysanthemicola]